jgi:hypothetical protein
MTTKNIRVSSQHTTCEICGRNLLRGEHADVYVAGGERHSVCDLCVPRALQDGWVREGTVPPYEPGEEARERRRPLIPWLRARFGEPRSDGESFDPPSNDEPPRPAYQAQRFGAAARAADWLHEPRQVHAVPTSPEQKVTCAIRAFNDSEHTRTIAGVARSLGSPAVSILPSDTEASVVRVVAAWELCWYRYEVDLAEELPSVRVAAQGGELEELEPTEREPNAAADEDGVLALRR